MSARDDIVQASRQFYSALNLMLKGDAKPMASAWSHGSGVSSMHPIGGCEIGWDKVGESFRQVAGISSGGEVRLADQHIEVDGNMAYETGIEKGRATLAEQAVSIEQRVTNVYRKIEGQWKMVHHHTDISPDMQKVIRSLR